MTADTREIATALGITFAKVAAFVALMLLVERQVIPRVLHYVAHTGSRELWLRVAIQQSVQSSRRCNTARPAMPRSRNAASASPARASGKAVAARA